MKHIDLNNMHVLAKHVHLSVAHAKAVAIARDIIVGALHEETAHRVLKGKESALTANIVKRMELFVPSRIPQLESFSFCHRTISQDKVSIRVRAVSDTTRSQSKRLTMSVIVNYGDQEWPVTLELVEDERIDWTRRLDLFRRANQWPEGVIEQHESLVPQMSDLVEAYNKASQELERVLQPLRNFGDVLVHPYSGFFWEQRGTR